MAGDVKVKVGADTTQLTTGLKKASGSVDSFASRTNVAAGAMSKLKSAMTATAVAGQKAMASLKTSVTGLIAAMGALVGIKSIFDDADQVDKLSKRFGESAESIQRLRFVAQNTGTSLETLAKALGRSELAAVAAAKGNTQMTEAFEALGISAAEYAGMSVEDRVQALADAYNNSTNKAESLEAMTRLLGRATSELIPLFAEGGDAIKKMMDGAKVASTDAVGRVAELKDTLGNLFADMKTGAITIFGSIIEGLQKLGIAIAGANAWWKTLFTSGFDRSAANDARDDVLIGGMNWLDKQKQRRENRANKITEEELLELGAEVGDAGDQAEEDLRLARERARELERAAKEAQKEAEAVARRLALEEKSAGVEKARKEQEEAKTILDKAKGAESNMVAADALRRIGGGFAKSNYAGVSREAQLISKQVDYASKQLDELKRIVTELRKADPLSGITT